jgi:hypothetical protein
MYVDDAELLVLKVNLIQAAKIVYISTSNE